MEEKVIEDLVKATEALSLATSSLRRSVAEQNPEEESLDYWELVEDAAPVTILDKETAGKLLFCGLETGPPPLPDCLRFLAEQRLSSRGGGAAFRALRAWKCGFWARLALDTCTDYRREEELDIPSAHWIVLAAPGSKGAKRTTRKVDCQKLLKEEGQGQVWDAFPSLTELQIFCAAAQVDVPPLVRWRSGK